MRKFLLLLLVLLVASACNAQPNTRHFKEIRDFTKGHSGAHFGLACFDCDGAFSRMYEVDAQGNVLSDTMLVWTQHFAEGDSIHMEKALMADMVITCYPNHIGSDQILQRHVFPRHDDIVVLTFRDNSRVTVTATDSVGFQILNREYDIVPPP